MSITSAKRQIQSVLDKYQPKLDSYPALLGDGQGNVEVSNRPGYVYIRMGDEETVGQAYNQRVSLREHLPVFVGYDSIDPRLFQVLSSRQSVYLSGGYAIIPDVGAHHATHEWPNIDDANSDGSDVVYSRWRQIQDLRISIDTGFTVEVTRSPIYRDGTGWTWIAEQSTNLAGYQPIGNAVYMLVYLDDNGILQEREGDQVPKATISITDCPDPNPGEFPLAAVLLYAGQTGLSDDRDEQNIIDLRWPQTYQATSDLIDHLHAGVAGDGGQISHDVALTDVSADDHHTEDHVTRHGDAAADPFIHIGIAAPGVTFPGKLWVDTS